MIGMWDGFTQYAAAGVITTAPTSASGCTTLRRAWRAVAEGAPTLGANPFNATGPATLVGASSPGGTVTLVTNEKVDGLASFSVSFQQGACTYNQIGRAHV